MTTAELPSCLRSLLWDRVAPWPSSSEATVTILTRVVVMGDIEQLRACSALYEASTIREVALGRHVRGLHPRARALLDLLADAAESPPGRGQRRT